VNPLIVQLGVHKEHEENCTKNTKELHPSNKKILSTYDSHRSNRR
jgi:hypothetical protein